MDRIARIGALVTAGIGGLVTQGAHGQAAGSAPRIELGTARVHLRGSPQRPDGQVGLVTAAAFAPGVGFVIADATNFRIHVVQDSTVRPFGGEGSGPGEMREPIAAFAIGRDSLAVIDRTLRRLTVFKFSNRAATVQRTFPLGLLPEDVCPSLDGLIALSYDRRTGTTVHLLSRDGSRILRSWGEPFVPDPDPRARARVNEIASRGRVLCLADGSVLVASRFTGELRLYNRSRALTWRRTLSPFVATRIQVVDRGGVLFGRQPGVRVTDMAITAVSLPNDLLLVQSGGVSRAHPGPGFDYERITSHILRASDGAELSRATDIPVILAASDREMLAAGSRDLDIWIEVRPFAIRTTATR